MRFIAVASMVCLLACAEVSVAQEKPELMRGVKKMTKCIFEINPDERNNETLLARWITDYNEHGDPTMVTIRQNDATFVDAWVYEYDAKGRKESCTYKMYSNRIREKSTFAYQADGACVKSVIVYSSADGPEKAICASTHEYNAKGQLTSEAYNLANGFKVPRMAYAYDGKGRITEMKKFFDSSPFPEVTSYIYDEKAESMTETVTSGEGKVLEKIMTALNVHNDPVRVQHYNAEDKMFLAKIFEYVYDADGRVLIESSNHRQGAAPAEHKQRKTTYQYEFYEKK